MASFQGQDIQLDILRKRAFNYRWATLPQDVIPLTAADPDFPVAPVITDAIKEYISSGIFSYGPAEGLIEFREAIAQWYLNTKNVTYSPEYILPVNSAAYGLYVAAETLLSIGENALVFEPVDFLFRKSIENAGATVLCSPLNKDDGTINREHALSIINDKTKVIFICNPNNPLGKAVTKSDLIWLGELAIQHNCIIISDEIWSDINYDNSFISIAAISEEVKNRTITIAGLSKNFALAGLRIGYMCMGNKELYDKVFIQSKHKSTAHGISTISQIAGIAALNHAKPWLDDFLIHLHKMKDYSEQRLKNYSFLQTNHPNATYLLFPKIVGLQHSSEELWQLILDRCKLALVPGGKQWFEQSSEGHLRICYATSFDILKEAFDRLDTLENYL